MNTTSLVSSVVTSQQSQNRPRSHYNLSTSRRTIFKCFQTTFIKIKLTSQGMLIAKYEILKFKIKIWVAVKPAFGQFKICLKTQFGPLTESITRNSVRTSGQKFGGVEVEK